MPYRPPGVLPCFEHIDLGDSRYSNVSIDTTAGAWMLWVDGSYVPVTRRWISPPRAERTDEQAAEHAVNMLALVAERQPKRVHIREVWKMAEVLFGCGPGKILVKSDTLAKLAPDEIMVINGDRSRVGVWVTDGIEQGLIVHRTPENGPPAALIFQAYWEDRYWRNVGV